MIGVFTDIILKDIGFEGSDEDKILSEINLTLREIKITNAKKDLVGIGILIRKYEASGEKDKLKKAQQEFGFITKNLAELEDKNFKGIIQ
jgi:hypothetical protein